jgi:hypothetical protein
MRTLWHVSRKKRHSFAYIAAMHDWLYRRRTTVVHETLIGHVVVEPAAAADLVRKVGQTTMTWFGTSLVVVRETRRSMAVPFLRGCAVILR